MSTIFGYEVAAIHEEDTRMFEVGPEGGVEAAKTKAEEYFNGFNGKAALWEYYEEEDRTATLIRKK